MNKVSFEISFFFRVVKGKRKRKVKEKWESVDRERKCAWRCLRIDSESERLETCRKVKLLFFVLSLSFVCMIEPRSTSDAHQRPKKMRRRRWRKIYGNVIFTSLLFRNINKRNQKKAFWEESWCRWADKEFYWLILGRRKGKWIRWNYVNCSFENKR